MASDSSRQTNISISGTGWMAGPYLTAKLSENLYFDARGAWGRSTNQINPLGAYTEAFETDRWLANTALSGNWHLDALRITPRVAVTYASETQRSYVDTLGLTIPEQRAHVGRLSFGPELAYEFHTVEGLLIEPHASLTGMWDFASGDAQSLKAIEATNVIRAKVEAGVTVHGRSGRSLTAQATYDGIGSSGFYAWGGQLWLTLPFETRWERIDTR
jgi:outer membrane autotransporter protein